MFRAIARPSALIVLLSASIAGSLPAAVDTTPHATPAAGVLASVSGDVKIDRPGSTAPLAGAIGLRLEPGDAVRVGTGSSATVYLVGGGIVRIPAGSRIEIPKEAGEMKTAAAGAGGSNAALRGAMSSRSVEVLEAGLWILNDPQGSVLLTSMRGAGDDWDLTENAGPLPLSPRFEMVLDQKPRLVWAGEGPVRVVIGRGKEVVFRSAPATAASLTLPDTAPELHPGEVYRWWLEAPDGGAPLSESVPFKVADKKLQADATKFEKEVSSLAGNDDGPAIASLMRCGYYVQIGAWSRVVRAASDLRRLDPASEAATRAIDGSRQQMRLGEDSIARLMTPVTIQPAAR